MGRKLWERCSRDAFGALYNPFVVALAAGTLSITSFQRYIAQDAFFLSSFAEAYGMALQSADDEEAKASIASLQHAVHEELRLHSSFAEKWGLDFTQPDAPNPATTKYTDFLLQTASECVDRASGTRDGELLKVTESNAEQRLHRCARTITAMTPCMRLYAFLGQELERHTGMGCKHPYQEWIETYSSVDFEASASQIEQLLDKLSVTFNEEVQASLEIIYKQAMALEVEFFSAQSLSTEAVQVPYFKLASAAKERLVFVSDFDSTCTVADSSSILADLTVKIAASSNTKNATSLQQQWDELVKEYLEEYEEVLSEALTLTGGSSTYKENELHELLEKMSMFEQTANEKVVKAGVLQGLSTADIQEVAKLMPLRPGCAHLLQRLRQEETHIDVQILSVCWSSTFIKGVFDNCGVEIPRICANELSVTGSVSDGDIMRSVETALDKEQFFDQILRGLSTKSESTTPRLVGDSRAVYIGDSVTDLPCLLRADIGIVIGKSATLDRVADAFAIRRQPLYAGVLQAERDQCDRSSGWRKGSGVLYTVSSWHEIEAFLLGYQE
ncbi:unnamed protein product [Sphagnum troendelagicum]|uniref:Thiaminase-2/PQQC domain-containing protein n=1 Tax=Sphagnum troendelagicum TaxID=128251 RepID=A0ABP0T9J7_9BRYO